MTRTLESQRADFETYPLPPLEEDWLELRKPWWNASLAACVFGEHEYVSLGDACTEKLRSDFKVLDEDTLKMFARGLNLEPYVASEVEAMTGLRLRRPSVLYRRGQIMATLDYEVDDDRHVEIKTTTKNLSGLVPRYWYWQAQAQMWCRDTITTYIGALEGPRLSVSLFEVDRDDDAISALCERVDTLMAAIAFGDLPPGVELSAENVQVLYPRDSGSSVELPPEAAEAVARYKDARRREKEAKEEKEEARDLVVTRLGPHALATVDGEQVASFRTTKDREVVDWKRLAAEHPALVAEYTGLQPGFRRFVIRDRAVDRLLTERSTHDDF